MCNIIIICSVDQQEHITSLVARHSMPRRILTSFISAAPFLFSSAALHAASFLLFHHVQSLEADTSEMSVSVKNSNSSRVESSIPAEKFNIKVRGFKCWAANVRALWLVSIRDAASQHGALCSKGRKILSALDGGFFSGTYLPP